LSVVSAADLEVLRLGNGPPVLFVHGSVVAADLTWRRQLELADALAEAPFPKLAISGEHSPAFEAVCDALGDGIGAERAVIPGRGHTIPSTGDPYNRALEAFMARAERERGTPITSTNPS
jgi:hypothetical protein